MGDVSEHKNTSFRIASNWIVFSIIEARFAGSSMHFGRGDEGYDGGKKKR